MEECTYCRTLPLSPLPAHQEGFRFMARIGPLPATVPPIPVICQFLCAANLLHSPPPPPTSPHPALAVLMSLLVCLMISTAIYFNYGGAFNSLHHSSHFPPQPPFPPPSPAPPPPSFSFSTPFGSQPFFLLPSLSNPTPFLSALQFLHHLSFSVLQLLYHLSLRIPQLLR